MPAAQIEQIRDTDLQQLMRQADGYLDEGKNVECVRACADAYLLLLQRHPEVVTALHKVMEAPRVKAGLETGTLRFAPLMFPRLAAKLHLPDGGEPSITFDRQTLGFAEAIQYYEFTLGVITDAEQGRLNTTGPGVSL
jgi:hypothetical protein